MKRSAHNRILVALLVLLTVLASVGVSASAQESDTSGTAVATATATEQVPTAEGEEVTDLPATGRGQGDRGTEQFAVQQMLVTLLVLVAAATLSLGVIALAWRYGRR